MKGACTCGKHEEHKISAKLPERGLGVTEDALRHSADRRPDLKGRICCEAQHVTNETEWIKTSSVMAPLA